MALLTVERSPSLEGLLSTSSDEADSQSADEKDASEDSFPESFSSKHPKIGRLRSPSFAGYFASRGGAVSIPDGNRARTPSPLHSRSCGELQLHLQTMITLLREDDIMKMAVRIESQLPDKKRYLTSVTSPNEESLLIGIDWVQGPTIGLVLELPSSTVAKLDGDGGFHVSLDMQRNYCFKPVSVQTLWSAMHVIQRGIDNSAKHNCDNEGYRNFVNYYQSKISSDIPSISEWNMMDNLLSTRQFDLILSEHEESEQAAVKKLLRPKLKEVMIKVDLDTITSRQIRKMCEEELGMDLSEFKSYLDTEMFTILGQMDSASKIFDYLYLGSEWNASDLDELKRLGIGHILNLTKEIDNFFPDTFVYFNVRVYDEEDTELLPYWEHTYKFIHNAKLAGSNVLVHCRRGISRSASSVIAYVMKSQNWSLTESMDYVKKCRSIVEPNAGFERQLIIYEGILNSSRNRYNVLFRQRSKSERQISLREKRRLFKSRRSNEISDDKIEETEPSSETGDTEDVVIGKKRPKSWAHSESREEENSVAKKELPSLIENTAGESSVAGEPPFVEELPSNGDSRQEISKDSGTQEKEAIEVEDGVMPTRDSIGKRRMMKRAKTLPCQSTSHWELTSKDEKLIKEDSAEQEEKEEKLVEQAMAASLMKRQLLRSLVQLQEKKGTRSILDNEFSVESIVRPSSLRKISMSRKLPFERRKSFSEETEANDRFKLRKRAMTVGAAKYFDDEYDDDDDTKNEAKDEDGNESAELAKDDNKCEDLLPEGNGCPKHEDSNTQDTEAKHVQNDNNPQSLDAKNSNDQCDPIIAPQTTEEASERCVIETSQFKTVKDSAKEFEERQKRRSERLSRKPRRHTVGECEIQKELDKDPTHAGQTRSKSSEGRRKNRDLSSSPLHKPNDNSDEEKGPDSNPRIFLMSANQDTESSVENRFNQSETGTNENAENLLLVAPRITSNKTEGDEQANSDQVSKDDVIPVEGGSNEDVSVRNLVEKHKKLIHKNSFSKDDSEVSPKSPTNIVPSSVGNEMLSYSENAQPNKLGELPNSKDDGNNNNDSVDLHNKIVKDTEVVQPGIVKRQSLLFTKPANNEAPESAVSDPAIDEIDPDMSKIEPDLSKIDPDMSKIEPAMSKIEPDLSKIDPELSNKSEEAMKEVDVAKMKKVKRNSVKERLQRLEGYQKNESSSKAAIGNREQDFIEPEVLKIEPEASSKRELEADGSIGTGEKSSSVKERLQVYQKKDLLEESTISDREPNVIDPDASKIEPELSIESEDFKQEGNISKTKRAKRSSVKERLQQLEACRKPPYGPAVCDPEPKVIDPAVSKMEPELPNKSDDRKEDDRSTTKLVKRNSIKERLEAYQKNLGTANTAIKRPDSLHSDKALENDVISILSPHNHPQLSSKSAPPSPRISKIWDKEHYSSLGDLSLSESQMALKCDNELSPLQTANEVVKGLVDKFEEY